MYQTEEANCNVTQGYKIFKQLKDLRVERKAKSQELNCLYALTGYIDCDAFADTCEANLSEVEDVMGVPEPENSTNSQFENTVQQEIYAVEKINDMVV